ncbi:MAG: PilT/PilU family type 4a pilus ATPase [Emcibacteraceae bacterium]|jgi:twitching motility protein PilT|tara:strand:- start:173 stop:1186 length:1014 start_codon:yes stop_codon:yes gene_type:complete
MLWALIQELAKKTELSDIHIHADRPIAYREHGEMKQLADHVTTAQSIDDFLKKFLEKEDHEHFNKTKDHDFAIESDGFRFRVNAFQENNAYALILRIITTNIPSFDDLNLPGYIRSIPTLETGLVLVTGPTGSGKSTTLATIIDVINKTQKGHIITIEDPVEFKHETQASVITQREVGRDTQSFTSALRASLREDPDVILVGELRDLETISLALTAAETGHLVFGTLHTNSAPSTIDRIIDVFPPEQQEQVRSQLASSLRCVITQKLLKRIDKVGRVGAFEIMICNAAIKNLIRENKIFQIANSMQMGKGEGQMLMGNSLKELISQGVIAAADAEIE